MKKTLTTCLATALAMALAGCALVPTEEQIRTGDYGPYPANYEAIVHGFMDGYLKDGESARYKFLNQPTKYAAGGLTVNYGYIVCVDVNAKNSYGAYVGYKMSYLLINNGQVIQSAHTDGSNDYLVEERCKPILAG